MSVHHALVHSSRCQKAAHLWVVPFYGLVLLLWEDLRNLMDQGTWPTTAESLSMNEISLSHQA